MSLNVAASGLLTFDSVTNISDMTLCKPVYNKMETFYCTVLVV